VNRRLLARVVKTAGESYRLAHRRLEQPNGDESAGVIETGFVRRNPARSWAKRSVPTLRL
jgi:hypothetical protein